MDAGHFFDQKIATDRILVQRPLAWAFLTNIPIVPGHTLIAPTRVVSRFEELTADERAEIFDLLASVKEALTKVFEATGFHVAWNEGADAGQSMPHFHLHVVPRKKGDTGITEYEPRKFLYRPGSREQTPDAELGAVADMIRATLS